MNWLAALLGIITTLTAVLASAANKLRAAAENPTATPELKATLLRLADQLDELRNSTDLQRLGQTLFDEARDAAMSGKSVVTHQPTDFF